MHTPHQLAGQGTSQFATATCMWQQQNGLHAVHGLGHDGVNMSHSGNRYTQTPGPNPHYAAIQTSPPWREADDFKPAKPL